MIRSIASSSPYLTVNSPAGYVNCNTSNGVDGQIRFNASTQQYEVFGNGSWTQIGVYASVDPSQKMIEILQWAESKMHMEQEVMKLIAENPTVADSYNNYKEAEAKLKTVMTLVKQS